MNILNAFNRIIKRASEMWSVKEDGSALVDKEFSINSHPLFAKTRMVLQVALTKGGKQGANKKRWEVRVNGKHYCYYFYNAQAFSNVCPCGWQASIITKEMENVVLIDIDHQVYSPHGAQIWLAFYYLVRLGIKGGAKLHEL